MTKKKIKNKIKIQIKINNKTKKNITKKVKFHTQQNINIKRFKSHFCQIVLNQCNHIQTELEKLLTKLFNIFQIFITQKETFNLQLLDTKIIVKVMDGIQNILLKYNTLQTNKHVNNLLGRLKKVEGSISQRLQQMDFLL